MRPDVKILVLGGASYDEIIHVHRFFEPKEQTVFAERTYAMSGSTGVGKAIAFRKLGFDVTLQAVIGNDLYGQMIMDELSQEGVRFHPYLADTTERHTNIMDDAGHRITIYKAQPNTLRIDVDRYEDLIRDADIVCLNIKNECRDFIPLIKKHHKPIYCDLHDYDLGNPYHDDFIQAADYLHFSSDRMPNYIPFMETLIDQGKGFVVATHAEKGACAMGQDKILHDITAEKIDIVDTNGAGDSFFAGFVTGHLLGRSIPECLLMGREAAEATIKSEKIAGESLCYDALMKKMAETEKN